MSKYDCINGEPQEIQTTFGVLPSDISIFPYIILNDCCETASSPVLTSTLSGVMAPYSSKEVTISGGCPPYKWEVTGAPGMSFTSLYTTTTSNTLYYDGSGAGNAAGSIVISDICYRQGQEGSTPIVDSSVAVVKDGSGDPWAIIFYAPTADCYIEGETSRIGLAPTFEVISLDVANVGVIATGTNPAYITTPADYTTTVSLSVNMYAAGYKWADGSDVYGTAVTSVFACDCDSGETASITYTTQQMEVGETQILGIDAEVEACYYLEITSGGGTLNGSFYTAAGTNANCVNNPTISLKKKEDDTIVDTLDIAVNAYGSGGVAFQELNGCEVDYAYSFSREPECAQIGCAPDGYGYAVSASNSYNRYKCDGTLLDIVGCAGSSASAGCGIFTWNCTTALAGVMSNCANNTPACGTMGDKRTPTMIANGCCPAALL